MKQHGVSGYNESIIIFYISNNVIILPRRSLKAVVDENADLCEKAMKIIKVLFY